MMNIYFPDEEILVNDLLFMCYMIERVARKVKQPNKYVVKCIGREQLMHLISVANVLHSMNPLQVESEWINQYNMEIGAYDVENVDSSLCENIPSAMDMGKVYTRLIVDTLNKEENFVDGLIRVYNHEICQIIDNYNASAYYEPSYVIERAYYNGGF